MVAKKVFLIPENYGECLEGLKSRIRSAQVRVALAVNRELIILYWHIGQEISLQVNRKKWGSKVIEQLSKDLKQAFPDMSGFSPRNLQYMKSFAIAYRDELILQQVVAQLPWGHNVTLLDKLEFQEERLWYAQQAIPPAQSDLVQQILKSPYNFEFLSLSRDAQEKELERGLIAHIKDFLMELGVGFAFLGSQYPIVVDDKEYKLDLLFYHARLHCYIVIELKIGDFEPEFSGKMNFYVSAVDHLLKTDEDKPTIGIILCGSKTKTTVEFALQDLQKPIGVATYQLKTHLPKSLENSLPTAEQLEIEMQAASLQVCNVVPQENCPITCWTICRVSVDYG
jgi:predicted nuclease of restriction endonuclease-like (RecB) superfamily